VQRVTDIIGEISAAAEQSSGLGQINGTVNELARATQQNAALMEESALPLRLDCPRASQTAPARRSVSSTGRRSTSRRPHQPAARASSAPATPPASGTHGEGFQSNWKA
jgi:hypothetical protein